MRTSSKTTLWQIGQKHSPETSLLRDGDWFSEYNYTVGLDAEPITRPRIPLIVAIPDEENQHQEKFSTGKLNIYFTLNKRFLAEELTLYYGFYGAEAYQLLLDGQPVKEGVSKHEDGLKQAEITLGAVNAGDHILTITVKYGSQEAHSMSYLKLEAKEGKTFDLEPVLPSPDKSWLSRFKILAIASS